jgi:hypothetical protein
VELVLGESRGVGECLSHVFLFEVWQVGDDLRWRHAIGDEVDDVSDRDSKPSNRRTARKHIRILCDPIERIRHASIMPGTENVDIKNQPGA